MLEKQCFIPEPEEFISETPMTAELKKIKKARFIAPVPILI